MSEVSGKMTDSWSPTPAIRREAIISFPHVSVDTVVYEFRDYYQHLEHNQVRTRSAWERTFLSWCARREGKYLTDRLDRPVEYDDVTGMPKNPKPMRFKEEEES